MSNNASELASLKSEIETLNQKLDMLQADILYIKNFFLEKERKKLRRRQKKEQQRLEIERQEKARKARAQYEAIVWQFTHHSWELMPAPSSRLSPKELQLVSLSATNTDQEVARKMNIKEDSISLRICSANKKLGLRSKQELIDYYAAYQKKYREHRHHRCITLLSWLLYPPPGRIQRRDYKLAWQRTLGPKRNFKYVGPYVTRKAFDWMREHVRTALDLKRKGLSRAEIAAKMKVKENTVASYFCDIRSTIKIMGNINITADEELLSLYDRYLKFDRKRKTKQ